MKRVFGDAGFFIAYVDRMDGLHDRAHALYESALLSRVITSEMVLVEVLNSLAGRKAVRAAGIEVCNALREHPLVEVVPQTQELFEEAFDLYRARPDKRWSMTDCASFTIMTRLDITEALTHDRHFQQAGFNALMRDD